MLLLTSFFVQRSAVEAFVTSGLDALPAQYRIKYFGTGERRKHAPRCEISNKNAYMRYLERYECAAKLFGDNYYLYVQPATEYPSFIDVWVRRWSAARLDATVQLMEVMESFGSEYSYGGEYDELDARNGYSFRLSCSLRLSHDWVGRDCRRYVPGLYWLNYFSNSYREQHNIDPEKLANDLSGSLLRLKNGVILRLYQSPSDWRQHAERVEHVIHETPGFFSKRRVHLPPVQTPKESLEIGRRLFDEWP